MKTQEAIQKMIEGGYRPKNGFIWGIESGRYIIMDDKGQRIGNLSITDILLDPESWKCLGSEKAMRWGNEIVMIDEVGHPKEWYYFLRCPVCGEIVTGELQECPNNCETEKAPIESWLYEWHRLIDTLAEGKSIDDYFKTI